LRTSLGNVICPFEVTVVMFMVSFLPKVHNTIPYARMQCGRCAAKRIKDRDVWQCQCLLSVERAAIGFRLAFRIVVQNIENLNRDMQGRGELMCFPLQIVSL